jgi:hypothetical protein
MTSGALPRRKMLPLALVSALAVAAQDGSGPGTDGVNVGIHTFGSDTGSFGSRSSAEIHGTDRAFRIDGDFELNIDNYASSTLTFNIIPGQVRAQGNSSNGLQPGDFLQSDLILSIEARDGASTDDGDFMQLFGTTARALVDSAGARVEWSGDDLGFSCGSGSPFSQFTGGGTTAACSFSGGNNSINFGSFAFLAASTAYDIRYSLTTIATGSVSLASGECGSGFDDHSGGLGDGLFLIGAVDGSGGGGSCRAVAQIGAPLVFVPEPASLGLLAPGLIAAGAARRKQSNAA